MTHTSEPWRVTGEDLDDGSRTKDGGWPFVVIEDREPAIGEALLWLAHGIQNEEDARRIVACVNACAGISTKALEARAVADATAALRAIVFQLNQGAVLERDWCVARGREAMAKLLMREDL